MLLRLISLVVFLGLFSISSYWEKRLIVLQCKLKERKYENKSTSTFYY